MAQYYTDFRSEAVGSGLPSGWTNRWATITASTVGENPLPESDVSFLAKPTGSYAREAASWDDVPDVQEAAVRVDATPLSGLNGIIAPVVCGSGNQAGRTGYTAFVRDSADVLLRRFVNGVETTIATTGPLAEFNNVRRIIELSVTAAGVVSLWTWPQSESKPATPLLTYTDASPLAAGWAGWFDVSADTFDGTRIHSVAVGTNGDSAPTGPPTPETPTGLIVGLTTANSITWGWDG